MSENIECVVEYEYSAEQPDELTLRVGDVITNVDKLEGGWWKGALHGITGMFPDNFVKVLPGGGSVNPMKGEDEESKTKPRCKVLFSYTPAHEDELALEVDEKVEYLCEVEDGWWKGRSKGRVGVFPSNFVEMCNTDCDNKPSHAVTVQEKNKKNSLGLNNSVFSGSESDKMDSPSILTGKKNSNSSMATSERQLRNTGAAPDTAPRLPPKPEKTSVPQLHPFPPCRSDQRYCVDLDDEPLGRTFGSLSTKIQEHRGSLSHYSNYSTPLPVLPERRGSLQPSDQTKSGFFSRLRTSFGSKGKLSFLSRSKSRLSVGHLESRNSNVQSPVTRRSSFAAFIKKVSPATNNSKYNLKIERSTGCLKEHKDSGRLSHSWEEMPSNSNVNQAHLNPNKLYPVEPQSYSFKHRFSCDQPHFYCETNQPTDASSTIVAVNMFQSSTPHNRSDTRKVPVSSTSSQDPETSSSWVFQELKPKPRKTKSLKLKYNPPRHSSSRPTPRGPTDTLETRSTSGSETSRFEDQNQDWSKDFPDSFTTGRPQSEDSGVAWDSLINSETLPTTQDIDSFFGSVGDLTDEVFNNIFHLQSQENQNQDRSQELSQRQSREQSQDLQFEPIQEEREVPADTCDPTEKLFRPEETKPRTWIRTNPFITWNPPDSIVRLKKVQVTEI